MPAEHSVLIAIAGIPVLLTTPSDVVMAFATGRFPLVQRGEPAARIGVGPLPEHATQPRLPAWSLHGQVLEVRTPHVAARIQLDDGSGSAAVDTIALATDPNARRALEGVLYSIVNRRDRHPLHAAALRLGDSSLVLYGPSGTGKSTLAWEAHRAGIHVLSDDATRIQLDPELRVWGDGTPARIHLLEDVERGDAAGRNAATETIGAGADRKASVTLPAPADWVPYGRNPRVVLLSRGGAQRVSVAQATADEILATLMSAPEAELDLSPGNRERVIHALSARGGFRMDLSPRAAEAIPHLREMLASISEPA